MNYLELKNQKRAHRPLFDRIISEKETLKDRVYLSAEELYASIAESLSNLLNTRAFIGEEDYTFLKPETLTYGVPVLYGLPDFSHYDPANKGSWQKLKRYMSNSIRLFESRLKLMDIEVQSFDVNSQTLSVVVRGKALFEGKYHSVSFNVDVVQPANQISKKK